MNTETPLEHCGIDTGATVSKIIERKQGGRIILYTSGDKVIEIPDQPTRTEKPDGRVVLDNGAGQVIESRIKKLIPPDERPLNVASGAVEPIGKLLSNFAERPFVLNGKEYRSVEAFYQGLKWPDEAKRASTAQLFGKEAKFSARGAPKADDFEYDGCSNRFGSAEHHQLIKHAIRASIVQHPEVRDRMIATHPRPIVHKTGRPENPNSSFPGSVFTRILTELRTEFLGTAGTGRAARDE